MKLPGKRIWSAAILAAGLLLSGCEEVQTPPAEESNDAVTVLEYDSFPGPDFPGGEVAVSACFQNDDGSSISSGETCLTVDEIQASFLLNEQGEIHVSGLPRDGIVELCLYDGDGLEIGHTTLHFSVGAVIDASSGEDGASYVTTQADTEAVALLFRVSGTGIQCMLHLDREGG